eukprot:UN23895
MAALSLIPLVKAYCKWAQFVICVFQFIIWCIHLDNKVRPANAANSDTENWCDEDRENADNKRYHCIGPNLYWWEEDRPQYDWNVQWRNVFTFRPEEFIDLWTPFIFYIGYIATF